MQRTIVRLFLVSFALVAILIIATHNMTIADAQAAANSAGSHGNATSAATPPLDWALAGLLICGALVAVLRPRRRKIAVEQ